jgi:hypothetical protein
MWMRTGTRCARRTQVKIGFTEASPALNRDSFAWENSAQGEAKRGNTEKAIFGETI